MAQISPLPPFKKRSKVGVIIALFLFVILLSGGGIYAYVTYLQPQAKEKEVRSDTDEVDSVVTKVRSLMELPEEEPTLATVSDVEKLKDQEFFAHAQNGDKVLIFQKAEKAILYRPSINKIIEVGPVTITLPQESASESASITQPLDLVLFNGSTKVGITNRAEDEMVDRFPEITVTDKENAKEKSYKETLIIDLTGKRADEAELLAEFFSGVITSMPKEEASPSGDILIILGSEYASQ